MQDTSGYYRIIGYYGRASQTGGAGRARVCGGHAVATFGSMNEKTGTTQIVKHRAMYTVYPHAVHKLFHLHEYMGLYEAQSGRFPLNLRGML